MQFPTYLFRVLVSLFTILASTATVSGQLIGEVREGQFVVVANEPTLVAGINLKSAGSLLTPIPNDKASPFELLVKNSPQQIVWGNLGSNVLLDGEWITEVGYSGTDPANDLTSRWGGNRPMNFPVVLSDAPRQDLPNVTPPTVVPPTVTPPDSPGTPTGPSTPQPTDAISPSFGISLDANSNFVLHTDQFQVNNLSFHSRSGGLIPANNAAPFPSLLSNNRRDIIFHSQKPLTLDGNITLSAGWDTNKRDLRLITYNDNGTIPIHVGNLPKCELNCTQPSVSVSLDNDQRFVLSGSGQILTSVDFMSNGNLLPADSSAPFAEIATNTDTHVGYRDSVGIIVDGSVSLSAGWNANGVVGDIRYEYTDASGDKTSGLALPNSLHLQNRHLDAIVNDENRLVLHGSGHRVNAIEFSSRSGSLVPGRLPAPFDRRGNVDSKKVEFFQATGNVVLDGEVELDVEWDANGNQDLRFAYEGAGNAPDGSYYLSRGSYPTGTDEPRPDVWVSVDENYKLILHANNKSLLGLEVKSDDGQLLPAASSDPFPLLLTNDTNAVTFGSLGAGVEVQGSIRTNVGINPLLDRKPLKVSYGVDGDPVEVEILDSDLSICPGCVVPEISFAEDGQILIEGFESDLVRIQLSSASGTLEPLILEASDFQMAFASASAIELAAEEGFDAYSLKPLPVNWTHWGHSDIVAEFTTVDGTTIGPFPVSKIQTKVVPEPSAFSIAGFALLGIALVRRRRRASLCE